MHWSYCSLALSHQHECHDIFNHWQLGCLFCSMLRQTTKQTSMLLRDRWMKCSRYQSIKWIWILHFNLLPHESKTLFHECKPKLTFLQCLSLYLFCPRSGASLWTGPDSETVDRVGIQAVYLMNCVFEIGDDTDMMCVFIRQLNLVIPFLPCTSTWSAERK